MGIKGLWEVFEPAAETQAIVNIAPVHGIKRVAIDIAIWTFQCKTAQGGENPLLRTLFYRLCRLVKIGLQAVFVFDGSSRPSTKRGKRVRKTRASHTVKDLISLFGFAIWQAPGEAEAECAYLQKYGIVDAVITDDVDALMFGAERVYRHWAAVDHTSTKRSSHASHASYFGLEKVTGLTGLDTKAMILVALLSGGDYHPAGIPGCGIKTAVEIAKAGYAQSMFCEVAQLHTWRVSLEQDLHDNAKGHFSSRHPRLVIPKSFPDMEVVQFYLHPTVSSQDGMLRMAEKIVWHPHIKLLALRSFTKQFFAWADFDGDIKFVKSLSHSILTDRLIAISSASTNGLSDFSTSQTEVGIGENNVALPLADLASLIQIRKIRNHPAADFLTEVQISCDSCQLVPIDIQWVTNEATQVRSADATSRKYDIISSNQQVALSQTRYWVLQIHLDNAFPSMMTTFASQHLERKTCHAVQQNVTGKDITHSKLHRQETLDRYFKQAKSSTTQQPLQHILSPIVPRTGLTIKSSVDNLRLNNEQQAAADLRCQSTIYANNWHSDTRDVNWHDDVVKTQRLKCSYRNAKNELKEMTDAAESIVEHACLKMQALNLRDTSTSHNNTMQRPQEFFTGDHGINCGHCKSAKCDHSSCQCTDCERAVQPICKISIRQSLGGVWQLANEEDHRAGDALRVFSVVEIIDLT